MVGEASVIMQTYPEFTAMNEKNLSKHLGASVMTYLCFKSNRFGLFDVRRPVKNDDEEYGVPNTGFHHIFDAWTHDPDLDTSLLKRDVASDGNKVLTRTL
eukprot:9438255-Karenia_brevis.AAC.1